MSVGAEGVGSPEQDDLGGRLDAAALVDATPECLLIVAADGTVVGANDRVEELTGFAKADLLGRPVELLIASDVVAMPPGSRVETVCLRADGEEVAVEVRVGAVDGDRPRRILTLRDTTELRAGRDAEVKFRALVEQISAITYTWAWDDDHYFVRYASPQLEEILGYAVADWIADPSAWYEWVHAEDRAGVIEENKRCERTGESHSMVYRMHRKDGRTIWVEDSWVVVADERDGQRVFQGVVFDVTARKEAEAEIAFRANHDKLTNLPNRHLYEEMLEKAIARARRHDHGVGVLYLDLDNFKLVNDSLGHHAGDQLLVELSERLRTCTRDTDLVARQGGDEFLLLLADLERGTGEPGEIDPSMVVTESVAERIREVLAQPFDLNGTQFYATGSIGVSLFPQDAHDAESLLRNADAAMYQSKKQEPGGYVVYATDGDDAMKRLSLTTRLREAVHHDHWVLHWQPIYDIETGAVDSLEALVRWLDPNGGLVPPGEFIPLAEELGLIEAIGDWVLAELVRQQAEWASQGLDLRVGFNLSPRQLWSAHLADKILAKLRSGGVDPASVIVEITESTAMADPDRTQKILSELHAWGFSLALDDFGTGYSSLARLKHMPVDVLKIDRAFVRDVHLDAGLASMVRAMIQLAQGLEMVPLAEGVETQQELEFLRGNGCRLAQGFLLSRPVPAEQIPELVARTFERTPG
ncbi:MAG TPA: EAL domain-containing protein [Actinomycetota bacterium]|nr:EAL domain-containing protein [Actinomycetota bacterium]